MVSLVRRAAANWVTLNFNGDYLMGSSPGTGTGVASTLGTVTLGGTANSDLSGTITGFGLFSDGVGSGNSRLDTFTIEADRRESSGYCPKSPSRSAVRSLA